MDWNKTSALIFSTYFISSTFKSIFRHTTLWHWTWFMSEYMKLAYLIFIFGSDHLFRCGFFFEGEGDGEWNVRFWITWYFVSERRWKNKFYQKLFKKATLFSKSPIIFGVCFMPSYLNYASLRCCLSFCEHLFSRRIFMFNPNGQR